MTVFMPVDIVKLDDMPRTSRGKIDYRVLEKTFLKANYFKWQE